MKQAGTRTGFGDEWLRIGAVKFAADGSASERTMRMSTPYEGRPDDHGILTMTQEEVHDVVEDAHRAGFQIGIHANGDVAIDMVLNAYERVQREWPRPDPRHRLEHCSLVNDDLLRRIKAVGAIPTPFYTYVFYHGDKWGNYGDAKMRWMFAHKSFLDHGIPVAGASDYIPGPFEPLMALQSMVTRGSTSGGRSGGRTSGSRSQQALRVATLNGAHASFEEDLKGSITAGKLADFVVLREDPHEIDAATPSRMSRWCARWWAAGRCTGDEVECGMGKGECGMNRGLRCSPRDHRRPPPRRYAPPLPQSWGWGCARRRGQRFRWRAVEIEPATLGALTRLA